jgi:hypothetical protein
VAVGVAANQPLVDRWDGSAWATVSVTTFTNGGQFAGVSCVTTTSCVAVGDTIKPGHVFGNTLVERSH